MKKLLMIGTGSYGSTLAIRLRGLAQHLAGDFAVTVMTPPADKYNNFTPDYSVTPRGYKLVQPWQLTTRSALINLVPYVATSLFKVITSRADVVYIYKPTPITVVGLVARLWGRQVIVDMDDLGSEVMKLEGQSKFTVVLVRWCEQLCLRFASRIVVSSTLLEYIARHKYPGKPVLLLPNAVEPTDYSPTPKRPLRNAVYFFGGLNRLDLVEDMLRAVPLVLAEYLDTHFTIAGGGTALDDAKKLAAQLGIAKAVTFTGWLSDMRAVQKHTSYGDIAVCYQPNGRTNRAASNMKVFQYMAMRTLPVVSDVGDLPHYIQDGKAGVVVPAGDSSKLAKELISLLRNPARRTGLTDAAYKLARTAHTWQHRARMLAGYIKERP